MIRMSADLSLRSASSRPLLSVWEARTRAAELTPHLLSCKAMIFPTCPVAPADEVKWMRSSPGRSSGLQSSKTGNEPGSSC